MYVSMKGMLERANKKYYAVMAIICFNLETARAAIDAAQELRAPIIIDLLQDHLTSHLGSRFLTKPIIKMAEEASVEVAINLDHGHDVAIVKQCLADGFSSVMMDASSHPYEENVAITKKWSNLRKYTVRVSRQKLVALAQLQGIITPIKKCTPIPK